MLEDAEADILAFYAFPASHWRKLRSTDENVKRAVGRSRPVSGDGSVAVGARRAVDRLLWPLSSAASPDRPDFGRREPSSRGDGVWRWGVSGR
jgi:hypothetical protein